MVKKEMIRVQCRHCGAVGRARVQAIPPEGLRLRCPKCGGRNLLRPPVQDEETSEFRFEPEAPSCRQCGRPVTPPHLLCPGCQTACLTGPKQPLPDKVYAGFWIRLAAKLLDGLILWMASLLLALPAGIFMGLSLVGGLAVSSPWAASLGLFLSGLLWLLQMAVPIAYTTFFLGRYGATPGKMLLRLKVVREDFSRVDYLRAFGRYFAEILSALILMAGYLMAAFDPEKRALHDVICKTRVVHAKR